MERAAIGGNAPGRSRSCSLGSLLAACLLAAAARRRVGAGRDRDRDLRRRLLLVRGGRLRQGAGRAQHDLGLHRRHGRQPDLQPGLGRRHRPRRGGRDRLRSRQGQLRRSCSTCSGTTSIRWRRTASSAISGDQYRTAIFYHDEEQRKLAEDIEEGGAGEIRAARGADRDRQGRPVLQGRGLSPGLLQEESESRYKFYRWNCGRDQRLEELWGKPKEQLEMIDRRDDVARRRAVSRSRLFAARCVLAAVADARRQRRRGNIRDREERRGMAAPADARGTTTCCATHGTERAGIEPAQQREAQGHLRLRRLRPAAVLLRDQVRERHRLAELLSAAAERGRRPRPTARCS